MSKKVLILSGSPRKGANSDTLCDEFLKGAVEAGHDVEKIFVSEKNIGYCRGCSVCQNTGECVIKDDMGEILDKILKTDVIVLSSPVYFYSISAQLKAVIDRCFAKWQQIKSKEFYYIVTAGEDSPKAVNCTLDCFRGFAVCLESSKEKGLICATGIFERGEIDGTAYIQRAYDMGKGV